MPLLDDPAHPEPRAQVRELQRRTGRPETGHVLHFELSARRRMPDRVARYEHRRRNLVEQQIDPDGVSTASSMTARNPVEAIRPTSASTPATSGSELIAWMTGPPV
jgi:hypothetical protein